MAQIFADIPCITGLFVAGVLSGALSTVSSGLSSLSAITFQDFKQSGFNVNIAEQKKALVCKVISVAYGCLCYGVLYMIKFVPGIMQVIVTACLLIFLLYL